MGWTERVEKCCLDLFVFKLTHHESRIKMKPKRCQILCTCKLLLSVCYDMICHAMLYYLAVVIRKNA